MIIIGKLRDTDQTYDQLKKKNILSIFLKNLTKANLPNSLFAVFEQIPFFLGYMCQAMCHCSICELGL